MIQDYGKVLFEGPSPTDNFLKAYAQGQQQKQQADQSQRADQQFQWQKEDHDIQAQDRKAAMAADALAQVKPGDAQGFEAVKQGLVQRGVIDAQTASQYDISHLAELQAKSEVYRKMKEAERAGQTFDLQQRTGESALQTQAAQRANLYSEAAKNKAAADRVGTMGNTGMPGGKPLPTRIQQEEDSDIGDIQNLQSINLQLDNQLAQIKKGDLPLGALSNVVSGAQNYLGVSTPGSRNFAEFQSTLEKIRNDSLRLNKGVQTEGDAIRAWNEVTKNITDEGVVSAQLNRIMRLNERAAQQKLQKINIRRRRNGAQDFNPNDVAVPQDNTPITVPSDSSVLDEADAILGIGK